jgi:hypothetical protein
MLRSLVLRVFRSLALGPRSLPLVRSYVIDCSRRKGTTSSFHPCGREVKSILNSMGKENLRSMGSVDNSGVLELQFKQLPPLSESPIPFQSLRLLTKSTSVRGSVCSVAEGSNRTGSSFFPGFRILFPSLLGPQEKGGMRPAIDLSILNTYLVVPHFKMKTNRSIRAAMLPGIWSTSFDLEDAYFHCPISVAFRKYLRFV